MQNRTVLHVGVLRLISTSIDVPLNVCDVRSSNGSGTRLRLRQERWSGSDAWAVDNLYVGPQCAQHCHGHGRCSHGHCRLVMVTGAAHMAAAGYSWSWLLLEWPLPVSLLSAQLYTVLTSQSVPDQSPDLYIYVYKYMYNVCCVWQVRRWLRRC